MGSKLYGIRRYRALAVLAFMERFLRVLFEGLDSLKIQTKILNTNYRMHAGRKTRGERMNLRIATAIMLGGALGALARFYISGILPVYRDFPVGTLLVNSIASFILGYLYGLLFWGIDVPADWRAFFGTGFCGALSTFSTFSYETFSLLREREYIIAGLNTAANVIITIVLVFTGFLLARR